MRQREKDGNEATGKELGTVRSILTSEWQEETGELLIYRVCGSGFLHHMVRNLVGTMLEIGRGQFAGDAMRKILLARSRAAAGPTAPACGLFLQAVYYDASARTKETEPAR